MNKILFPTEFSEHAPEVLRYALVLADAYNAKLLMLHAFGKPENPGVDVNYAERTDKVKEKLKAFREAHQEEQYAKIEGEYLAQVAFASESILQVAQREEVDLIVMGTQGQTVALERYFGSTSSKVLNNAGCPVLLIPPTAKFNGFNRFACTTNFDFQDLQVLNALNRWSKKVDATVSCLHVVEKKKQLPLAERKAKLLRQLFESNERFSIEILVGDIEETIENFSKASNADLMAMVQDSRSFIARLIDADITKGVARDIHIPLLVFDKM